MDGRDYWIMRGRERYHSLSAEDLAVALAEAPYAVSGLSAPRKGRPCTLLFFAAQTRAEAEGLLLEAEAPKRPCGLSRALCWASHPSPCKRAPTGPRASGGAS